MTPPPGTWPAALEEFDRVLEAQRQALAERTGPVAPFIPPQGLGPLPAELLVRAQNLLEQAQDLEAEMTAAMVLAKRRARLLTKARACGVDGFADREHHYLDARS